MPILLKLEDAHTYRAEAVGNRKDVRLRMKDIPSADAFFERTSSGVDRISHWEIPRADLMEICHQFGRHEIAADKKVKKDLRVLDNLLSMSLDERPRDSLKDFQFSGYKEPYKFQRDYVAIDENLARLVNCLKTGRGKCLGRGTPVIMYDGTMKKVEDVEVGDLLMGPDSQPRRVASLARGRERMYKVIPVKGTPWTCNESHILSLKYTLDHSRIVNMSVRDYLQQHNKFKHEHKLWRPDGIDFPQHSTDLRMDPYLLGLWLGDGSVGIPQITNPDQEIVDYLQVSAAKLGLELRCYDDPRTHCPTWSFSSRKLGGHPGDNGFINGLKHYGIYRQKKIPRAYLCASRADRLQLLAGLIDTDGAKGDGVIDFIQKNRRLAKQVAFLCRSLGFAAYIHPCEKYCTYKGEKRGGTYYRVCISGDLSQIPLKVERKKFAPRQQKKSVLVTGFKLEDLGEGDYFGFDLDGPDRLFLLGDFTVTHNTFAALERARRLGFTKLLIVTIQAVIEDWEVDVMEMTEYEPLVYYGDKKKREKLRQHINDHEVVIATYETAGEINVESAGFDSFIIDEADMLANPETERWKSFKPIFKATGPASAGYSVQQLTATPMGNHPVSVWPILWLCHPFLAGTRKTFINRFQQIERTVTRPVKTVGPNGDVIYRKKQVGIGVVPINQDELQERLASVIFISKASDRMPFEDVERIIPVGMTDAQREMYDELRENLLAEIGDRRVVIKDAFSKTTRLLQAADGLMNFDPESRESGKLERLHEILTRAKKKKRKVIVWSRFLPMLYCLQELFPDCSVMYNGKMTKAQKTLAKWSFNGVSTDIARRKFDELREGRNWEFDAGEALFFFGIIHGKSSRGMNLQAGAYQIFPSFSFSAPAMEQTKGRITRWGQQADKVLSHYFCCEDTWEPRCLQYVLRRRLSAEELVRGKSGISNRQMRDMLGFLEAS